MYIRPCTACGYGGSRLRSPLSRWFFSSASNALSGLVPAGLPLRLTLHRAETHTLVLRAAGALDGAEDGDFAEAMCRYLRRSSGEWCSTFRVSR